MWAILFPLFLVYYFGWFVVSHESYIMRFYGPRDPWGFPDLLKEKQEEEFLENYK